MKIYEPIPKSNFSLTVDLPGSKSITNRALILAVLSKKRTILKNILLSDDTKYMIEALKKLGNTINFLTPNTIEVIGVNELLFDNIELFIGNAGTAMRFLASYLATGKGSATLTGVERMKERPIKDLVDALISLGIKVEYLDKIGFPPIKITSNGIIKNEVSIDGSLSSQYISSILMAAPSFDTSLKVRFKGNLVSTPYIKMTLKMMKDFNIDFVENKNSIEFKPCTYGLKNYIVEGDMSSASYFLAMALISNSTITINNFFKNSIQGDQKFLSILVSMGLKIISQSDTSITIKGCGSYKGIELDMNEIPDVAQTLASVALFATTPTTVKNVANMRIKETDRISALKNEILKLNGNFIEFEDGFKIIPKNEYTGATLETYDDHRMAMALSLIGLKVFGIKILNPDCVSKTFPNYFIEFSKIYEVS